MADTKARRTAARKPAAAKGARKRPAAAEPHVEERPVCTVAFCPICAAVGAAQEVRPEAVGHLLAAGREMLLAVRALVDARAQETEERPARLEKIDIA